MTAITSADHLHREAVIHAEMIRAAFKAARGLPLSNEAQTLCTPSSTLTAPVVRAVQVAGLASNQFPPSQVPPPGFSQQAPGVHPAGSFLADQEESEGGSND